jgi:predicted amidohydrolase
MKLKIATCQFPIDGNVERNRDYVLGQMTASKKCGAVVVHFPETALSGYASLEFGSFRGYNWDLLDACAQQIMDHARKLKVWVILGSSHRLTGRHKPHNSVYVINDHGRIIDRYDKMFCTGDRRGLSGDLKNYSPGDHFCVFTIRGIRCGVLICHDFRYDELVREYKRRGVQLLLFSYHNGHTTKAHLRKFSNIHAIAVPATMQAYAANNNMWISANNTSARESQWPSFFVRPDGNITGRLRRNVTGILYTTVDTRAKLYDASADWRDRALAGIYHSGKLVRDKRSTCRTKY